MKNLNAWMLLACVSLLSGCDEALDDGADGGADTSTGDGGATLKSLVAKSGGVEIGVVLDADLYGLTIWDRRNDIIFYLNQATGNVGGLPEPYGGMNRVDSSFGDAECTLPYGLSVDPYTFGSRGSGVCPVTAPLRRRAWSLGNDDLGFESGTAVFVTVGPPSTQYWRISDQTGACSLVEVQGGLGLGLCVYQTATTTEIPTHFSLPIEVVER